MDNLHPGTVIFDLEMPEFTRNAFDVSHGGALTTYVDIATTTAIYAFDAKSRTQVSAGLDMSFFSPAVIGE
jgi:acyl-coenzyme A thioesterase PaaI-like protein